MIVKNKILIYDTSRGYNRFVKLNFKELEVNSFLEYSNFEAIDFGTYDAVIFIVNHPIELADLIWVQEKIAPIFFGTRLFEINNKIKKFENTIFLDLQQNRQEMIDFIKCNFKLLGMLEIETV